jgi:long-chain acyl-CoA synthetase
VSGFPAGVIGPVSHWKVAVMIALVHDLLRRTARQLPSHPAIIDGGRVLTFSELDQASERLACGLRGAGLARGDRVAVCLENSAELVISLFGVLKAGGVYVAINPTVKAPKLAYIFQDCGVRGLIAQPGVSRVVGAAVAQAPGVRALAWTSLPPEGAPAGLDFSSLLDQPVPSFDGAAVIDQDLCMILYTSGTTGQPKGVMLTHQNVVSTAASIARYLENVPEDVVCCVLPMAFSYGLYQLFAMAQVGYTLAIEKSFAYPVDVLRRMQQHRVTGFAAVPGIFATMLQVVPSCGIDLSSLRYMTNAAGPISPTHIQEILKLLPRAGFYSMYGQTECARACYMAPDRVLRKPTSVGRAIPNTEIYLVDEQDRRLGPGVVGQLVVRGGNVMRGYWNRPDLTAAKLREGPVPGERVLYTGDLFRMDDEGDFYFVSRMDDIIKCKGEKVSPKEVEDILYQLRGVAEAAVVGVDDPLDGQAVKAYLVCAEGHRLDEQEVRRYCRANLESHMVPKYVEFRESLPKTDSGKITRAGLLSEGAAGGAR